VSLAGEGTAADQLRAAEFIGVDDPRWLRLLERTPHDIYHLPEYVALSARHEGGRAAAFYAEDHGGGAFLAPLLLRRLPDALEAPRDWLDAASPYGYPSPLAVTSADGGGGALRSLVARSLDAFRAAGRSLRLVTAFFRLHPLLALAPDSFAGFGTIATHGPVVYVDLTRPEELLWSETRGSYRTAIRGLERDGYTVTINEWHRYRDFAAVYHQTMQRVGAADRYFFSDDYFADLRHTVGERLHLSTVVTPGGETAAAALFFGTGTLLQYHLGGTADAHVGQSPAKLLFHHARRWGKRAGFAALHLGGGVGAATDSLFHFKSGFSPLRAHFRTARIVLDTERYEELCVRWAERVGMPDPDPSAFFPLYRQGLRDARRVAFPWLPSPLPPPPADDPCPQR